MKRSTRIRLNILLLVLSTSICIGYAAVSGNLSISGTAQYETKEYKGIYIKSVAVEEQYTNGVTVAENTFELPTNHIAAATPQRAGASITYRITVHNNTDVTYTFNSGSVRPCSTMINFFFDIRMDAMHDEFLAVLNNLKFPNSYDYLADVFNTNYPKTGSTSISSASHPEVFKTLFDSLTVDIDGTEKKRTL